MEFLKVYDDVVKEFGFGIRCGIYSKILEFHMNGAACHMSKQGMAAFIQCRKSSVCEAIAYLLEDTEHVLDVVDGKKKRIELADADGKPIPKEPYIIATHRKKDNGSADTTVYSINERHELFKRIMSNSETDSPKSGQGSPKIGQGGCPENGQGVVQKSDKGLSENRTEKENINRELEQRKGEERNAHARDSAPDVKNSFSVNSGNQPKELTKEQENHIRYGFKYQGVKHSAGYYIEKCKKYGYDIVIGFIHDDGVPENPNEEADIKNAEMYALLSDGDIETQRILENGGFIKDGQLYDSLGTPILC